MSHPPAVPDPALSLPRRFLRGLLRRAEWAEKLVVLVFSFPLYPLEILFLVLIAGFGLGAELGLEDLYWHEIPGIQFLVGLATGLLVGQALFVRALLQLRKPSTEAGRAQVGLFVAWGWPVVLLALYLPYFALRAETGTERLCTLPMLIGLALSYLLGYLPALVLVRWLADPAVERASQRLAWLPAAKRGDMPPEERPLHILATWIAIAVVGFFILIVVLHTYGIIIWTPFLVLCFLFAVFNSGYGFLTFQLRGVQHLVVIAVIFVGVLCNSDAIYRPHDYKLSFPNMDDYYQGIRNAVSANATEPAVGEYVVRLDEVRSVGADGKIERLDHYRDLLRHTTHSREAAKLIDSDLPLQKMKERRQDEHKDRPGSKPLLVVVAASGGGIRAAVWTAVVLEALDQEVHGLRDHIRMICGASGGMVAAGLYVADFHTAIDPTRDFDAATGLGPLSRPLAKDSLSPTVQTMLLSDLLSIARPWPPGEDRGRELEAAWKRNTKPANGQSPLAMKLRDLGDDEREGKRPSLVFSPMLVEDSRRLLVSNLDLENITRTWGDQLSLEAQPPFSPEGPTRSLSAVEFFRLFPNADNFEVGTAARMSASFPIVSPGVSLPTYPARRVVDAGYYDNYGVNVAGMWLYRHRQAIRENTAGVVVIEVRAYRNGYARRHLQDEERQPTGRRVPGEGPVGSPNSRKGFVAQSIEWLSTPAEAILTEYDRSAWYRNDELLHILDDEFNTDKRPHPFFTTVDFEFDGDAALSWYLSRDDAAGIVKGFYKGPERKEKPEYIDNRVKALRGWFGDGGR